jgi:hypothetical protein
MTKSKQELKDLNQLAVDRCRKAFTSVAQLVEDDAVLISILIGIAHDFIQTAAQGIVELRGGTQERAVAFILTKMAEALIPDEDEDGVQDTNLQ